MERISTALKTLGHPERLRILALLSRGELTVSELVQILSLSQPRVTQYISSLEAAGIIERLKEGSWVFSRIRRGNAAITALVATILAALPEDDPVLIADRRRLDDVRLDRAKVAQAFFADVANDRGQLGDEYLPRTDIEDKMLSMVGEGPFEFMADLGTGTARILEVFSDRINRGSGIDSSHEMLKVARHNLANAERRHISVRQGDLHATPLETGVADLVTLHQVLHFLDEPREAIAEAARLLSPGGKLLIVDFDSHTREEFREKYAHRRLGFKDSDIAGWMQDGDISLSNTVSLESGDASRPGIKLWLGERLSTSTRRASWLQ